MRLMIDRFGTPIGDIVIVSDGQALHALEFVDHEELTVKRLRRFYPDAPIEPARDPGGFKDRIDAYFAGALDRLEAIPATPRGTLFQLRVWRALREIPVGTTTTYGALARQLGLKAGASRAVGLANGANPVSLVVPCHRVIGANDKLVGYGGGLYRKQWLLEHEGVQLRFGATESSARKRLSA